MLSKISLGGSRKTERRPSALFGSYAKYCAIHLRDLAKPEPLKHGLTSAWSRRIDSEHRLVYQILETKIRIVACRYHY
jgi:Txe/YoeB family toxin of Txe-Axe toxin-antitoxin module